MATLDTEFIDSRRKALGGYLWIALAVILLVTVAYLSYDALGTIKEQHTKKVADTLTTILRTSNNAANVWIHDRTDDTQNMVARPDTRSLIKELLSLSPTKEALMSSPVLGELRKIIAERMEEHEDLGFFVINPDRVSIGSMRDANLGTENLLEKHGYYLDNLFAGEVQIIMPMRSDVALPGVDGKLRDGEPTMFIAVPVFDDDGSVMAAFTIRINPFKHFTRVMELARVGETGDVYAFDFIGRLLTESRHNAQLRDIGLLGDNERSTLSVSLRDPGDNMLYGYRPTLKRDEMPLTKMAFKALQGVPGIDVEGYRDYRGVPVVGTWLWNGTYQFGLVAEMSVSEAYHSYYIIKKVVLFVLSVMILFFLAIVLFVLRRNFNYSADNERLNYEIKERERAIDELKSVTASKDELAHEMDERRRFEIALTESEEKMRSISEAAMDAIIMIDNNAKVIYWNPAAERIYGYAVKEALGVSLAKLIIPQRFLEEQGDGFSAFKFAGTGALVGSTVELTARRKDGSEFQVEQSVSALKKDGRWCAVGISKDITERKVADEALRNESEIRRNLLKISEATIHTADIDRFLNEVVNTTHEFMCSDFTLSYLWEDEIKCFRPINGAGLSEDVAPFFMTESIDSNVGFIESIFDGARVSMLNLSDDNIRKDIEESGLFNWAAPLGAISLIPLKGRQKKLGLLVTLCKKESHKKHDDCSSEEKTVLLQAVANNASTALEEAKHYKDSIDATMELSRKVETIQTMGEIGKSILSSHKSSVILKTTIRMISKLIACDLVRIILVDSKTQELNFVGSLDDENISQNRIVSYNDSSLTDVVVNARAEYIPNLMSIPAPKFIEGDLIERGFASALRVPVVIKGKVFAVLGAMSSQRAGFSSEDRDILEKLASQIGVALENARLLTDLEELFIGTVKVLAGTIEAKSSWTRGHSDRVTGFAVNIGRRLGLNEEELKNLRLAGLLHDIGKIGIHEDILNKSGKLTDLEFKRIRSHPGKGAEMLLPIKPLQDIIPSIKHHHENYDGSGYPDGIAGEDIPFFARILAVADTVDAMGANRPYRKGLSMVVIVGELKRCSGKQFDSTVVDAFLETLEISDFPRPAAND